MTQAGENSALLKENSATAGVKRIVAHPTLVNAKKCILFSMQCFLYLVQWIMFISDEVYITYSVCDVDVIQYVREHLLSLQQQFSYMLMSENKKKWWIMWQYV